VPLSPLIALLVLLLLLLFPVPHPAVGQCLLSPADHLSPLQDHHPHQQQQQQQQECL
jgi:hypothetical protein